MSRPLQPYTIIELTLKAERNWNNKPELQIIQSELQHRTTNAAAKLRQQFEIWLADCEKTLNAKAA